MWLLAMVLCFSLFLSLTPLPSPTTKGRMKTAGYSILRGGVAVSGGPGSLLWYRMDVHEPDTDRLARLVPSRWARDQQPCMQVMACQYQPRGLQRLKGLGKLCTLYI